MNRLEQTRLIANKSLVEISAKQKFDFNNKQVFLTWPETEENLFRMGF